MLALALTVSLLAPGDILVRWSAPTVKLEPAQVAKLSDIVTDIYPSVPVADVIKASFAKQDGGVFGAVERNETLDKATLFGLATAAAGQPVGSGSRVIMPGISAGARSKWLSPALVAGPSLTKLASFVAAVWPGVPVGRVLAIECARRDGGVECGMLWAKPHDQHQLWAEHVNRTELLIVGVE